MSMESEHLNLLIGACLDLAERMSASPGKELMLDVIDDLLSQTSDLDVEGAPTMGVAEPHIPGRDGAALAEPEKD